MLKSEIIYNIKNLIAGGVQSDDQSLSDAQLSFIVDYYRAKLLKQDQNQGRFNQSLYVQNLGKVSLIQTDKNECCEADPCILRTSLQIPKPLETFKSLNLTFVGSLNGKPYQKFLHNALPWKKARKWTGKETSWYYQNGYVYVVDPPTEMLTYVNIQGVFENPKEAVVFRTCDCPGNGETCFDKYSFDYEYPLPLHYVDTIVKLVAESELRVLTSIPVDTSNNAMTQIVDMLQKTEK